MKLKQKKKQRPYDKPRVRVIELATEEVLAIGCKTDTGGNNWGNWACTTDNCSQSGS